jgi:hypothetical protein
MSVEYLTPKPAVEEFTLPVCPPTPRLPHKVLDWAPTSSLSCSFFDDDNTLLDLSIESFLSGTGKNKSPPSPLFLKRSNDGIRTMPKLRLKPRPSKYSPSITPVDTCAFKSMKRSPSSQQIYLMSRSKKSNLKRSPSFSRAA